MTLSYDKAVSGKTTDRILHEMIDYANFHFTFAVDRIAMPLLGAFYDAIKIA